MFWALMITLLVSLPAFGQGPSLHDYSVAQFTTKDGLLSNVCHDVVTDDEGFVWVAMDGGLMRFDGSQFKSYGDEIDLGNQTLIHMRKGPSGTLWLHSLTGDVYVFSNKTDKLAFHPENDSIKTVLRKTLGYSRGLFYVNDDQRLYLYKYGKDEVFYVDSLGNFHTIGTDLGQKGIEVIQLEDGHYIPIVVNRKINALDSLQGVRAGNDIKRVNRDLRDRDRLQSVKYGDLLFQVPVSKANFETNKFVYPLNKDTLFLQSNSQLSIFTANELITNIPSEHLILDIFKMGDGSFLIGYKGDQGLKWFKNVKAIIENEYTQLLEGCSVTSICGDRDGGFWVSTLEKGILNFREKTAHQVIEEEELRFLEFDGDSSLIIGDLNSVKSFNLVSGETNYIIEGSKEIRDILVANSFDRLIVSAIPAISYDLENQKNTFVLHRFIPFYSTSGEIVLERVPTGLKKVKILKDSSFVGIASTYLLKYHFSDSTAYFSSNLEDGRRYLRINDIQDFNGDHVMATDTGLVVYGEKNLYPYFTKGHRLNEKVSELDLLGDNLVVTNENKGFYILTPDNKIANYFFGIDYPGNIINQIVTDEHFLYVCSDQGLTIFDYQNDSLSLSNHVSSEDGLSEQEVIDVCRVGDTIYVLTPKGVDKLNHNDLETRRGKVIVEYLNDIHIDDRDRVYTISPGDNLVVKYATPRRVKEVFNLNRYRINRGEWVYSRTNEIRFTALSPGNYDLEICVQDNNGEWNFCDRVSFRKMQVWYKSLTFFILLSLTVVVLLFYYFRFRIRNQEKRKAIELRLLDLERKALGAQMNPHFIFNVLNSIQNFLYFNDNKSAMKFLSKFAHLVRKSLDASSRSYITLEEELDLIRNYLELEQYRNNNRFNYSVELNSPINPSVILIPPMLVQPIVENAVFHGMKDVDSGGEVSVLYTVKSSLIQVDVKDNGSGLLREELLKSESHGIKLTRERLSLVNKPGADTFEIDSENGKGTSARLYISYKLI